MSGIPQACFAKVQGFFNGDLDKTWLWFKTENPGLGMITPLHMIKLGRANKLEKFIDSRLGGYI